MLVSNVSRAIMKKLAMKFKGNEILGVDDFDVFACYQNLWKIAPEKWNIVRQGIIHSGGCTLTCMKSQINAEDKGSLTTQDTAIANAYGNKFIIPLNFKMLNSIMPCYQSGLRKRLSYKITFTDYDRVIESPGSPLKPDTKYKIVDVSLEYEIINQPDLARHIEMEYQSMALPYDSVLRDRQIPVNTLDTTWSWSFNTPFKSLKGILVLFEAEHTLDTRASSTIQR